MNTSQQFEKVLRILTCPISGTPLSFASGPCLKEMLGSAKPSPPLTLALISEDNLRAYPVSEDLIDLRPESAIQLSPSAVADHRSMQLDEETTAGESVKEWYDEFGWQKGGDGTYNDSAFFSQQRSDPYKLYEALSHHSQIRHFDGGMFFLDAASGAVAHPEYIPYSRQYQYRVCVDFSTTALTEARKKLGDHGIYILADVCNLPFTDNSMEGIMSGYTVQHIHRDQQKTALSELFRVLEPEKTLCIMTSQEHGQLHRFVFRCARKIAQFSSTFLNDESQLPSPEPSVTPPHPLYGHCWSYEWWKRISRELSDESTIECLRIFSDREFDQVIKKKTSARNLQAIEGLFGKFLARASSLISIRVTKPLSKH